ncbi:MAG TPA: hypothetical protein VKU85_10080, partial [bacterium]|nr:hypothetical protein [bacterium]
MATRSLSPGTLDARAAEWRSRLAIFVSGLLAFETLSGLSIWLLPFSVPNQFLVLAHTAAGILFLVPYLIYQARHWLRYWRRPWSHYLVTGYVAFAAVLLNAVSGVVLTVQATFGTRITYGWDLAHIVTTLAIIAFLIPHVVLIVLRDGRSRSEAARPLLSAERRWTFGVLGLTVAGFAALLVATSVHRPAEWNNEFPADYEWEEHSSPFRPSLATTESGGAYDD